MNERDAHAFNDRQEISRSSEFSGSSGAGGEPSGEPPALPPRILEGVPVDIRRQLLGEVVGELLAGARSEEEIFGPGGVFGQLTSGWWSGRSRLS